MFDRLLLHKLSVLRSSRKCNEIDMHNGNNDDYNNSRKHNIPNRKSTPNKKNIHNMRPNKSKWINLYRLMDILVVLLAHLSKTFGDHMTTRLWNGVTIFFIILNF